jgi:hypothetical protein
MWRIPTRNELRAIRTNLRYDPQTGHLWWKLPGPKRRLAVPAGKTNKNDYINVVLFRRSYGAHRIACYLMTGIWPKKDVDHENRIKSDNRWKNLRVATRGQNNANLPRLRRNTSGFKGVHWHPGAKKWRARIGINRKQLHIGFFIDPKQAHVAYVAAAKKHFGKFTRAA